MESPWLEFAEDRVHGRERKFSTNEVLSEERCIGSFHDGGWFLTNEVVPR